MKRTKLIFISLLIFILLSLTAISAAESADSDDTLMTDDSNTGEISINNTDELSISNDIKETANQYVADEKLNANTYSFSDLRSLINSQSSGIIDLENDYKYSDGDGDSGIEIHDKTITIDGHGHTIDGDGKSIIFRTDGGHVTLKNLIVKKGHSESGSGGAIYIKNGEYTIENCTFSENYAYDDGGAIYIDAESRATIKNSKLDWNKVEIGVSRNDDGGAIYSLGSLIVESCDFIFNSAYGYGGAIYSTGNLRLTGKCTFVNNYASKDGGAIYAKKIDNGTIENMYFEGNRAHYGGAVYLKSDNAVTFKNCNFKINYALGFAGGAICSDGSGETTIQNCEFEDNKATDFEITGEGTSGDGFIDFKGGAVYADNELVIDNCYFKNNFAADCGGAVYANSGLTWGDNPSIFIGNTVRPYAADVIHRKGGAVYATKFNSDPHNLIFIDNSGEYGGAIYINNENHVTFDSCYFENNVAYVPKRNTGPESGQGGAIYLDSSSSELSLINNIFINNKAVEGQVTYNCGNYKTIQNNYWGTNNPDFGSDLIIEWHRFGSNDKHKDSSPLKLELFLNASGIGISDTYLLTARFTDSNGNPFTGKLTNIDRIGFATDKKATFSSKDIQDAQVTTMFKPLESEAYKISAKVNNFELISTDVNVMGSFEYLEYLINTATPNSVIDLHIDVNYNPEEYTSTKGISINKNLTINGNGHLISGAGLTRIFNIISGHVTINNILFVDGKANYGGAILASSNANVFISNCEFRNNHATFEGGAIYLKSSNSNITDCLFYNNHLDQDYGGAISCEGEHNNIISCEFIENRAQNDGGALSVSGEYNLVSDCNFTNNTANNAGAAYWAGKNGQIKDSEFINNSAEIDGGAVYWSGQNGEIDGSTFKGNSAKFRGGAIRSADELPITIKNSCLLDNRAGSNYIFFGTTGMHIDVEFTGKENYINAIYSHSPTITNVTFWNGAIVNSDVVGKITKAAGQKVNIEIYNENNNLAKNVTLITDDNGKASYFFNELDDGKYTYTVCHYEDSYYGYYRTSTSGKFTLERKEMEGNIEFNNLKDEYPYGDITINFTVENRNEVRVVITDEEKTKIFLDQIVEGDNVTFSLPADKKYVITVSNLGNVTHKTKTVTGTFSIVKATPEIQIADIGTVGYGDDVTISYTCDYVTDFIVSVHNIGTDKGVYFNLTRLNPIVLSNLDIGTYRITILSRNDENHTISNATSEFEVTGQKTNRASVNVNEAEFGQESIITVSAKIDGEYAVDINGTIVKVTVVDHKGNASISLAAGNYYANLTFNNPNYKTTLENTTFNVLKAKSITYAYGADEVTCGNNLTIFIDGSYLTSFNVTVTNSDGEIVFTKITSEEMVTISNLAVGQYNVTVVNLGNENIAESAGVFSLNVTMNNHVTVYVANATYGEEVFLMVLADVDGKYSVDVNNTIITIDVSDGYGYDILDLAAGQYYANISSIEITGYDNIITNATFNIEKAKSNLKISEIKNDVVSGNVTIKFNDDYSTVFHITISGKDTPYVTHETSITIPLTPGEYNVTIKSEGNENVTGTEVSSKFNVTNDNYIEVYVDDVAYGEKTIIYLFADVDGNYTVYVNGSEVKIKVENGIGEGNITLDVGSYYANATFEDDGDYNHIITNATFNVTPYGSEVIIEDIEDVYKGDDVIVRFRCENLTNFTVYLFNEDGTYINETNTTENSIILSGLDEGIYIVFIEAIGNENIAGSDDYAIFEVIGYNIIFVSVDDVTYGEDAIVIVEADIDGIYTVDINGMIMNVTVANGIGNASVSLGAGNYHANATLEGINLTNICIDDIFTVEKAKSNVTIAPIKDVTAGNNVKIEFNDKYINSFIVTVKNKAGEIIFNKTINGNSVEIPNMAIGEYGVTVIAVGNENITGSEASSSFKVTDPGVVIYKLTGKNVAMYYFDGTKYQVKITRSDGKPVGANQIVVIKLNKKTYKLKTDKNGVTTLKIPNTVKPGSYQLTATYNGKTIKNTIKVKQNLKTKKTVKVKKSAKKMVLKATLKNGKKAIKGKKITFKFKGKTYKAKTNKKGIAKVTIKQKIIKKLKAGKKYTVKVTYLKNTIKSTVKVRR